MIQRSLSSSPALRHFGQLLEPQLQSFNAELGNGRVVLGRGDLYGSKEILGKAKCGLY
jgi:hypothetical protein